MHPESLLTRGSFTAKWYANLATKLVQMVSINPDPAKQEKETHHGNQNHHHRSQRKNWRICKTGLCEGAPHHYSSGNSQSDCAAGT